MLQILIDVTLTETHPADKKYKKDKKDRSTQGPRMKDQYYIILEIFNLLEISF